MATARVFMHGNSQAVRLPKEFRVKEKELEISRRGNVLTLRPKRSTYEEIIAAISKFHRRIEREQPPDQLRLANWLRPSRG